MGLCLQSKKLLGSSGREALRTPNEEPQRSQTAICASNGKSGNFQIWVQVNGRRARTLIDSGCTGNYISPEFARRFGKPLHHKKESYILTTFEGNPMAYNQG